jgi:hypothetical protein
VVRLLAMCAVSWVLSDRSAWAGIGRRDFVVEVSSADVTTFEAGMADAADYGATGVLFTLDDVSRARTELVRRACALAEERDIELWLGIEQPWDITPRAVAEIASEPVVGVALLFPAPQGDPAEPGHLAVQLEIKTRGERLGQLIRQIKAGLPDNRKLAVSIAASEIDAETARGRFLPVKDLIRDGTLDSVWLGGAESFIFHRLRLLRDKPLRAGIFLGGTSSDERQRSGLLERAALASVENPTCDGLWVRGFPRAIAARGVHQAVERRTQAEARRRALEEAISRGALAVDQEVSEKGCIDQASVHGVAQSFVPSRDGVCPLVQLYVAIRGCSGPLPPPLAVEIRDDQGDKPGSTVLADTEIPAAEFGHEPTYRWGSAYFDPPVPLRQGVKYWIYLPSARHPEGSFVWRVLKDGANARGRAWSRSYDYVNHTWVFRVFISQVD